ncbi:MAG: transposase [Ignavibacterium sp.]
MKFIQGHNRNQINLFPVSLDQSIDPDNEVRIIDLFVDSLSEKDFGFRTDFVENGRPAYHPSDLLKLFIYGYLNKLRSSRDLEKECGRNIEVMWLLKCLTPDHNTISNFRRDYPKAIKKVFRATVQTARHLTIVMLKEYLRMLVSLFLTIFDLIRSISKVCDEISFSGIQLSFRKTLSLKPL